MAKGQNTLADKEEVYRFAIQFLRRNRITTVQALENAVSKRFARRLDRRPISGKKYQRWQNLVDWAKAKLTEDNQIRYIRWKGQKNGTLLFLPVENDRVQMSASRVWSMLLSVYDIGWRDGIHFKKLLGY